jgi:hypothetical protein
MSAQIKTGLMAHPPPPKAKADRRPKVQRKSLPTSLYEREGLPLF